MKPKNTVKKLLLISVAIPALSLVGVSCNKANNPLTRSTAEDQNKNSNSQTAQNNSNTNSDDQGQVAGAETVNLPTKNIKVNDLDLNVEVADNDATREQGLSGRDKLDDGKGMLFDFTNSDFRKPGFWMKDMNFSIDIIWIKDGKVIGVQANAPVPNNDGDLPVYYPPSEISQVLEVPSGWSAKNSIKVGSTVSL